MNLQTPKHLPVHCCCEPVKRLGWVRVEGAHVPGPRSFCKEQGHFEISGKALAQAKARYVPAKYIRTEIAWLTLENGDRILAVKSGHETVEEWNNVVGFIADRHDLRDAAVR